MLKQRLWNVLAGVALCLGAAADAQTRDSAVVRVVVVDTVGSPLVNAQVTVLSGLSTVLATGLTDSTGTKILVLTSAGALQLVVRRVGSRRSSQFFTATASVATLRVALSPVVTTLPEVRVVARVDPKRASYHVDADDIAESTRPLLDALDVVTKLRPDMMRPRAATPVDPCEPRHVWVNGQRIVLAPVDEEALVHGSQIRSVSRSTPHWVGTAPVARAPTGIGRVPLNVLSVLRSIRPEHVEEINYVDCTGTVGDRPSMSSSVFVVLKKGVAFEPGIGSFVGGRTPQVAARAGADPDSASRVPQRP